MRDELDKALVEKYPLIFADRNKPASETCMCWGFECGDGWYNIIDALCANIQGHIDNTANNIKWAQEWNSKVNNPDYEWPDYYPVREERRVPEPIPQIVATQVKEKYGILRFYVNYSNPVIDAMIGLAESMSARTCEVCGAPGTRGGDGWLRTTCEEHA